MGENFLDVTSALANWSWAETSMVAALIVIALLTLRAIIERDRAMTVGKGAEVRRAAYEERWRSGRMTGQ